MVAKCQFGVRASEYFSSDNALQLPVRQRCHIQSCTLSVGGHILEAAPDPFDLHQSTELMMLEARDMRN